MPCANSRNKVREPRWISKAVLLAVHSEQLAEHGGASGIRDEGGLESALARPRQLLTYGEPDLAALAAAYAFGLCGNHPFVDGNKRTSFVITELFLDLNGFRLAMDDAETVTLWLALASGEIEEAALADRLRAAMQAVAS